MNRHQQSQVMCLHSMLQPSLPRNNRIPSRCYLRLKDEIVGLKRPIMMSHIPYGIMASLLFCCMLIVGLSAEDSSSSAKHKLLHFKQWDLPLNEHNLWKFSTVPESNGVTTACSSVPRAPFVCISYIDDEPGFKIHFNGQEFDFAKDSDWMHIDTIYFINATYNTKRQLLANDDYFYDDYGGYTDENNGYGYGMGYGMRGRYGRGMMGGMMGGGMYGGGMYGGSGMYGGGMSGMYGGYSPYGMNGRGRRRKKRRKSKMEKYLEDGGQFGKMGFPSLSGNMMGVVQSSKGMAPFMMVPPVENIYQNHLVCSHSDLSPFHYLCAIYPVDSYQCKISKIDGIHRREYG